MDRAKSKHTQRLWWHAWLFTGSKKGVVLMTGTDMTTSKRMLEFRPMSGFAYRYLGSNMWLDRTLVLRDENQKRRQHYQGLGKTS